VTRTRVVVLAGGFSPERAVSLASGANVAVQLRRRNYEVVLVDLSGGPLDIEAEREYQGAIRNAPDAHEMEQLRKRTDVLALLKSPILSDANVVFPVVHGTFGEDGRLQAVLDTAGLRYVGSGPLGQALAMDKDVAKHLFLRHGVPTPDWKRVVRGTHSTKSARYPVVVKPNSGGSTIGMSVCWNEEELNLGLTQAFRYDHEILIEDFIKGREFTVGMLGDQVLAIGEIRSAGRIFDYQAKYQAASTEEMFPADLPSNTVNTVQQAAQRSANALRQRHYCRMDFIVDADDRLFVLEVNAVPGLTSKSLYPQSAAAAGLSFDVVCDRLCQMALADAGC
jgi:D-alanine-D-alanine ligase